MRLGLFGGSFDPVHYGHLLVAECCREQARLDEVWFVPAASPPHKLDVELASGEARAEMLELATGGHEAFRVCRIEIERGGVSYTVDTVQSIGQRHPEAELFLLMGSDTLHDLPNWREPSRILESATPLVAHRAASAAPDFTVLAPLAPAERIAAIAALRVDVPQIDLKSRELRARVAHGQSIRYRTPRAVEQYIAATGLYQKA